MTIIILVTINIASISITIMPGSGTSNAHLCILGGQRGMHAAQWIHYSSAKAFRWFLSIQDKLGRSGRSGNLSYFFFYLQDPRHISQLLSLEINSCCNL